MITLQYNSELQIYFPLPLNYLVYNLNLIVLNPDRYVVTNPDVTHSQVN